MAMIAINNREIMPIVDYVTLRYRGSYIVNATLRNKRALLRILHRQGNPIPLDISNFRTENFHNTYLLITTCPTHSA